MKLKCNLIANKLCDKIGWSVSHRFGDHSKLKSKGWKFVFPISKLIRHEVRHHVIEFINRGCNVIESINED